jgi:hypothetical protein
VAGHALEGVEFPPLRRSLVDRYLADVARDLPGRPAARAAAMEEVRHGLDEAMAVYTADGATPTVAEETAVAELGPPVTVARAFAPELAIRHARRTLVAFLISGPLVGIWWWRLFAPHRWPPSPRSLWAGLPILPLVGAAVATAVIVLGTTGSLIRWLPEATPERALRAATGVAIGCVICDVVVLSMLGARVAATAWHPPVALAALAIIASLLRLACASSALLGCRSSLRRLRLLGREPVTRNDHGWGRISP